MIFLRGSAKSAGELCLPASVIAPRPCLPLLLTAMQVGRQETLFILVPLPVWWPDSKIGLFKLVVM